MVILSKAQSTSIDNNSQNDKFIRSIQLHTSSISHHHGVALEAIALVGVFDALSGKMCGRWGIVF